MQLFLFCGPGLRTPLITMLDLRTGCVADRLNVSEVIGVSGEDADIAVYALSGNLALGEFRYKAEQTYHLFLINVSAHRLLATSDGLRITVQRDYVERISDEAALVSCVEKNPRTSQTESVGTVRCRRVDLKSAYFSTLETLKYDPGKQLALQVKGHGFAIFPRYRFDYVSSRLLDVRGPDNFREPPPSAEELEKRIARIQSDLTAQVGKEADIPVYHLDIKDEKGK
ncbi:MAG: hypothetical protein NTU83_04030 [Candidatus Hydrogenedentes bacterium]|nr:hypothetical protein [Candidatus Hydrogenedentota bacterium]